MLLRLKQVCCVNEFRFGEGLFYKQTHSGLALAVLIEVLKRKYCLKGRVHGLAHARESKCCFFSCAHRSELHKQYYFIPLLKNQPEASRLLGCEIFLPRFRVE